MPHKQEGIKKHYKLFVIIALFAGIVIATTIIGFPTKPQHTKNLERKIWSEADFHLKKVTFQEFKREKLVWQMKTEDAKVYQEFDVATLQGIFSTFYQENGKVITLTGNEGRVKLSSMDVSITGKVHAKTEDGTELFANSFDWENDKRLIKTGDSVLIKRNNIQIEGIGLELDPDRQLMSIQNKVRTFIGVAEG